MSGIKVDLNCARKYTAIKIINISLQKSLKSVWSQVASAQDPSLFCLAPIHPKHREEQTGKHWEALEAAAGMSCPHQEGQVGHPPSFTGFYAQQDMVSLQSTCRKDADEICGFYLLSFVLLGSGSPGKSLSQAQLTGVLSKAMAALQPWCSAGLLVWFAAEQERTQSCDIQAGICLSQLPRERQRCLFHCSPKVGSKLESKPHLASKRLGCVGLKNHMLAGAKEGK